MKVCLYLEFYNFLGGILFNKIGTGLLNSYRNQKALLDSLKIPYTEKWDDFCDILVANTPWLKSLYLIKKAKRRGRKTIVSCHVTAEDALAVFRFMPFIAPIFKMYLKYAYDLADIILAPSEYTKLLLAAYGIKEEKVIVQSNGVDLGKFYRDERKRREGRNKFNLKNIVVGTVGLMIPRKGIDTFLKLAEHFSSVPFVWYGKIYSPILVRPLPKEIPCNVRFTGYVDDILAAFNSLDIFIFPSYEENQGMAILEAAACGLPIIVRDIPVYNGWLVHGENCLKAKDDQDFITQLDRLLTNDRLRVELSRGAQSLAQKESLKNLAANFKKLLTTMF